MTPTTNRGLLGCCSSLLCERPSSLAQTRAWHARVDHFLELSRPLIVPTFVALGFLASFAADQLNRGPALLPAAAFFALVGGWCSLSFARCREAHCVVIGTGYAGLAVAAVIGFVLDLRWTGPLWLASLALLAAGAVFEAAWTAGRGSNAVRRSETLEES
jgi:hypothetical protein